MAQTERSRGWEIGSRVTVNSDYTFATMFGLLSDYPIPTPALPLKGEGAKMHSEIPNTPFPFKGKVGMGMGEVACQKRTLTRRPSNSSSEIMVSVNGSRGSSANTPS